MNYATNYFDQWDVMTFSQFFNSNTGRGREQEFVDYVMCHICKNQLLMKNIEEGRVIKWKVTPKDLYAVCSEACFNIYVFQNL
jgi:hypothetical protein